MASMKKVAKPLVLSNSEVDYISTKGAKPPKQLQLYKPEDENLRANLDGCLVHSAHCVLSVHPSCMQQDLLTLRVDV